MRQLKISRPLPEERRPRPEHTEQLLAHWAGLGSTGLSAEAGALHHYLEDYARSVVSLAQQYTHPSVNLETVVAAAHRALIAQLNLYARNVNKLDKWLVYSLRNAMAAAVQAPAGGAI